MRRLVPVVGIALALGLLLMTARWIHIYEGGSGLSLLVVAVALLFVVALRAAALLLYRMDVRRGQMEEELRKVHRALRTLSECNQAVMRATDESALLSDICRIIVDVGGYRFGWVGYALHDEAQTVRPIARAGYEEGYLDLVDITWADSERGRGPAGTVIRTGTPCVITNTQTDPCFSVWREEAARRGYMACAGVPLTADGSVLGVLLIYAKEPGAFAAEEMRLLTQLADDLAYGIGALRARSEQKRVQEHRAALLEITTDLSSARDLRESVERVQQRAAAVLRCDALATFASDMPRGRMRMIAHYGIPPALLPEVEKLAFSPDEPFQGRLAAGETIVIHDNRQQQWLPRELVAGVHAVGLIAAPLRARDRHLGALVAINFSAGRPFDAGQIELCKGIARQLAIAIEAAEAFRVQEEEAQVSAALARVSQELIASLDAPGFLDRLGQVTAEVLECDSSHTLLYQPDEDVYAPVAGYGATSEERQIAHMVKVPRALMSELLGRLERDEVAQVGTIPPDLLSMPRQQQLGVMISLCMALRRGKDLIGLQVALSRGRAEAFSHTQHRIAQGIAQVASVALEHARVVAELERANRLKSDFVATMSHELRTPLNIIIGYNDLLRDEMFGRLTPDQADVLKRMDGSAQQLLELITATLDLSRLEAGRLPLELADCNLHNLLADLTAETRHLQEKPGVSLLWNVAPQLPLLHTDVIKLKVVVKNLVSNAVKFTESGSVVVDVGARDGGVDISVTDTGIGIAADALPIIFEPFRQADSSPTRHYGGVGLGLYITRRLLDMLGGTITVESEVGRGSVFRAWVPPTVDGQRDAAVAENRAA